MKTTMKKLFVFAALCGVSLGAGAFDIKKDFFGNSDDMPDWDEASKNNHESASYGPVRGLRMGRGVFKDSYGYDHSRKIGAGLASANLGRVEKN